MGSSVSTKIPPSLTLRVKSENRASTVEYSMRTVIGARCERRRSTAARVSARDRSAIACGIVRPPGALEPEAPRPPASPALGALPPGQGLERAVGAQAHEPALRHHHVIQHWN